MRTLVSTDSIGAGDTAWLLTSTALVLMMMVPRLALFYGGLVRKKNVLSTLMQSFAVPCRVTILWWLIGYSWAFSSAGPYLGGMSARCSVASPTFTVSMAISSAYRASPRRYPNRYSRCSC